MREDAVSLLKSGKTNAEVAEILGLSRATISYHAQKAGLAPKAGKLRYDWYAVQEFYDQGHTMRECMGRFGFAGGSWTDAVRAGRIRPRSTDRTDVEVFCEHSKVARSAVKRRLLSKGLVKDRCSICGQRPRWKGRLLVMVLDHINGVRDDCRIRNLRLLCPNCNSQTETFTGRNIRRGR